MLAATLIAKRIDSDGFPSRDDLERFAYLRKARQALDGEFINTKIAGRDYQIGAIRAVMEAIEMRKTRFLLVMATGSGKTRTCIALVDALMRAGWAESPCPEDGGNFRCALS